MSIDKRIINRRKDLDLNQAALAKKAGLTAPSISQYESGSRNPSYEALVKLSAALNVSVDYLVSGHEQEGDINDPESRIITKIVQSLDNTQKTNLMNFLHLLTGQSVMFKLNSTNPKKYADHLFKSVLHDSFPIHIEKLASLLNIQIFDASLGDRTEAMLLKRSGTIIIDKTIGNPARQKLTIATLIGHFILPWHSKETYYHRKNGSSTTTSENMESQEAMMFATSLLTPSKILEEDFSSLPSGEIDIHYLESLANDKYDVSVTMFCNRIVEFDKQRFHLVTSKDGVIDKVHSSNILFSKDDLLPRGSIASEINSKGGDEQILRSKKISSKVWIKDAPESEYLFESSMYSPKYGILTFLSKL